MNIRDIDIEELTLSEIKVFREKARELDAVFGSQPIADVKTSDHPWSVGENYLIRTVTMIQTGRLVSVGDKELVLAGAAWIADTGRFSDALENCDFSEVEPFPSGEPAIIGRGSIIDAVRIKSAPQVQK